MPPVWNGGGGGDPTHPGAGGGSSGTPCEDLKQRDDYNLAAVADWWTQTTGLSIDDFNALSPEAQCSVSLEYYGEGHTGQTHWDPPEDNGGGLVPPTGANEIETIYEGKYSGVYVGLWAKGNILAVQVRTPALGLVPASDNRTLWEFPDLNSMINAVSAVGDRLKSLGFD